jgi:hypothetical protein
MEDAETCIDENEINTNSGMTVIPDVEHALYDTKVFKDFYNIDEHLLQKYLENNRVKYYEKDDIFANDYKKYLVELVLCDLILRDGTDNLPILNTTMLKGLCRRFFIRYTDMRKGMMVYCLRRRRNGEYLDELNENMKKFYSTDNIKRKFFNN